MTGDLRQATVAGRFFPGSAEALAGTVKSLLDAAGRDRAPPPTPPRAVISPHAGYAFSGALTALALGRSRGAAPARIAILSPAHRHAFDGIALPSQPGYALPGMAPGIDAAARDGLVAAGLARVLDAAHDMEHGIETQLPFLHALHPGVPVVPLVIGRAAIGDVSAAVDALATMAGRTLFVLSSDLSHFLTQAQAAAHDAEAARKIETGADAALDGRDACGARGIAGYLASGFGRGARALRLGMTTSFAVTGDAGRVVGYGAWSLHAPGEDMLDDAARAGLLQVAREALEARVGTGREIAAEPADFRPELQTHAASFVTLEIGGRLRGCIGSLAPRMAVVRDVAENAVKAGLSDPRFAAVTEAELDRIRIKLSVLSRAARADFGSEAEARGLLVPGETGAILVSGRQRGVFLPQVWESLPAPDAFLRGLKRKAGLGEDHWSDAVELHLFRGETFGEAG